MVNGYDMNTERSVGGKEFVSTAPKDLADTVDWRKQGYVTGVKNQVRLRLGWRGMG